jgi:GNAT superfamily N-acetyltransferase
VLFGALGALALFAKPTALLPVAAVLAYLAWRDRPAAARATVALAAVIAVGGALVLARSGPAGVYEHLVVHNAFPYDPRNPVLLAALAALLVGGLAVLAARHGDGMGRAYLAGAAGVVLLGGHEGATFNYLLDLVAASCLVLSRAPIGSLALAPAVLTGHLVATLALTLAGPLGAPSLSQHAARVAVVAGLPSDGTYYAEDSGPLIAAGLRPAVDDTYVWARLVALGVRADDVTPRVEARAFRAIVSDGPLDQLGSAPEFRRQRWPPALVEAVLRNYRLDASVPGAYRYVPRS